MQFIDLKSQYRRLQADIDQRIATVLAHGAYIMGPEVGALEARLQAFVDGSHAITVASGTDALVIALLALELKAGDEVITTPFSFVATAGAIALVGATPVFVDIDPLTYNLDPGLLAAALTPHTRAILPVSLYGQCADLDAINAIAADAGVAVVEDAAQSFGARYRGRRSCALTTIACTSFYPAKPLGCYGDGGACFTADAALAQRMRELRDHGQAGRYHHVRIGLNGRLDTLQAAILLAKLDIFEDEITARQAVAHRYDDALPALGLRPPQISAGNTSVFAQYTIEVAGRAALQAALTGQSIPTAVHYPVPLHRQPAFASLGLGVGSFPHAERAAERVLSLPLHPYLTEADQDAVIAGLRTALAATGLEHDSHA